MDWLSFVFGLIVGVWGFLRMIYPEDSKWFSKKWISLVEDRLLTTSLSFILTGLIFLLIVWFTNRFLLLLVVGSFLLYTGVKYLLFGKKVMELSKKSLRASPNRWRLTGLWLLLGGSGLVYLSTWF